jgi:hypothetical protein
LRAAEVVLLLLHSTNCKLLQHTQCNMPAPAPLACCNQSCHLLLLAHSRGQCAADASAQEQVRRVVKPGANLTASGGQIIPRDHSRGCCRCHSPQAGGAFPPALPALVELQPAPAPARPLLDLP